ncbi:MAG: PIN domain-containing protein [Rickettsiales bacterium]|jgi:tRNA(fMet)-specific endonuclease VapC|nr:PIN domain-containing protein [Rickettsiales bacterium]
MRYLLDTCVLSDFIKGDIKTIKRIKNCSPSELAISAITIMEIEYGTLLLQDKISVAIKDILMDFIQSIKIIPFNKEIALEAALIRANLHKQGKSIGYYDILIGATAAFHNLTMITSNIEEFNKIEKLIVYNWQE